MAVIKRSSTSYLLESISGQVGGLVFRHRNGKTIVSRKPVRTKVNLSPQCMAVRDKFTTVSKFAGFLSRIPLLAAVWKTVPMNGYSTVTKLVKYNAKKIGQYWPTVQNTLTPDTYHIKIERLVMSGQELFLIMDRSYDPDPADKLVTILCAYDPHNPEFDKFLLKDISPAEPAFRLDIDTSGFPEYKSITLYCALIRQTDTGIQWSNTVTLTMNN